MINPRTHASLVEATAPRPQDAGMGAEAQARDGAIPAVRHPQDGWLLGRDEAEAVIKGWVE